MISTTFAASSTLASPLTAAASFKEIAPANTMWIAIGTLALLVLAVTMVLVAVALSQPAKTTPTPSGAHRSAGNKSQWIRSIEATQKRYHAQEISEEEAFSELAGIARRFASARLDRDVTSHTLAELHGVPRTSKTAKGVDLLRQTIAALYPPEFADEATDRQAGSASVDEAVGWVTNLVERWRA